MDCWRVRRIARGIRIVMLETASAAAVAIPGDILEQVHALHGDGLYLQAYRRGNEVAPLREWRGTAAQILAGRLAVNLGAPRLCWWHHTWAWRQDRHDPEACYYYARAVCDRRGAWAGWTFVRACGDFEDAPAHFRADWLAFQAGLVGRQRDFMTGETLLDQAERLAPDRPWIKIERAAVLEYQAATAIRWLPLGTRWSCGPGIAPASRASRTRCNCSIATPRRSSCSPRPTSAWNAA